MTRKIISIICFVLLIGCANEQGAPRTTPTEKITPDTEQLSDDHIKPNSPDENSSYGATENPENPIKKIASTSDEYSYLENTLEHPKQQKSKKPEKVDVRGIYLNRTSIREENVQKYIDLVKNTNLNAVVIDVKDDYGKLTYDSNIALANQIGSDSSPATKDLKKLIQRFKDAGIYTIARVVVFKDPYLAANKNEYAIKRKDGTVWQDAAGTKWVDPYKEEVWNYITSIAQEVSDNGFDEIQYDYIRFPEKAKQVDQQVQYDNPNGLSKPENILAFLKHSEEKLSNYPVYVSADVFGLVTTASDDMGIGQVWENISPHVDYISPMTYPSHYAPGSYGVPNPDRAPYDIMLQAMKDAKQRNSKLLKDSEKVAIIRPWIQDFDYLSVYSAEDVRKQIQALHDQGITQYLIWNAGNVYTVEALK